MREAPRRREIPTTSLAWARTELVVMLLNCESCYCCCYGVVDAVPRVYQNGFRLSSVDVQVRSFKRIRWYSWTAEESREYKMQTCPKCLLSPVTSCHIGSKESNTVGVSLNGDSSPNGDHDAIVEKQCRCTKRPGSTTIPLPSSISAIHTFLFAPHQLSRAFIQVNHNHQNGTKHKVSGAELQQLATSRHHLSLSLPRLKFSFLHSRSLDNHHYFCYYYYCHYSSFQKIRFFLLQNRQGKTRLSKWYVPPPTTSTSGATTTAETEKVRIEAEVHRLVTARDKKYTNFIEYNNYKIIYRRYAGLFFTIAVDVQDNELSYLETIHLFVELLDAYFSNVCELDIVFNFNKVYSILDEFMLAGEVQETSKREILDRVKFLEKME